MEIDQLKLDKLKLKLDYKARDKLIKEDIQKERYNQNKIFKKDHKKWFLVLDIAIVLIILMNLGALLITNALVVKQTPAEELHFVEVNPVVATSSGFQGVPGGFFIMLQIIRTALAWTLLIFMYIYRRNKIYNIDQLYILTFYILFLSILLGTDFVNDLGFALGKIG